MHFPYASTSESQASLSSSQTSSPPAQLQRSSHSSSQPAFSAAFWPSSQVFAQSTSFASSEALSQSFASSQTDSQSAPQPTAKSERASIGTIMIFLRFIAYSSWFSR